MMHELSKWLPSIPNVIRCLKGDFIDATNRIVNPPHRFLPALSSVTQRESEERLEYWVSLLTITPFATIAICESIYFAALCVRCMWKSIDSNGPEATGYTPIPHMRSRSSSMSIGSNGPEANGYTPIPRIRSRSSSMSIGSNGPEANGYTPIPHMRSRSSSRSPVIGPIPSDRRAKIFFAEVFEKCNLVYHISCISIVLLCLQCDWLTLNTGLAWEMWFLWQLMFMLWHVISTCLFCYDGVIPGVHLKIVAAVISSTIPCASEPIDTMKDWVITGACFKVGASPVNALLAFVCIGLERRLGVKAPAWHIFNGGCKKIQAFLPVLVVQIAIPIVWAMCVILMFVFGYLALLVTSDPAVMLQLMQWIFSLPPWWYQTYMSEGFFLCILSVYVIVFSHWNVCTLEQTRHDLIKSYHGILEIDAFSDTQSENIRMKIETAVLQKSQEMTSSARLVIAWDEDWPQAFIGLMLVSRYMSLSSCSFFVFSVIVSFSKGLLIPTTHRALMFWKRSLWRREVLALENEFKKTWHRTVQQLRDVSSADLNAVISDTVDFFEKEVLSTSNIGWYMDDSFEVFGPVCQEAREVVGTNFKTVPKALFVTAGFTLKQCIDAGQLSTEDQTHLKEVRDMGYSLDAFLQSDITPKQCLEIGFTKENVLEQCKNYPFSMTQLHAAGFTMAQCVHCLHRNRASELLDAHFAILGASGGAEAANCVWSITGTHNSKPKYQSAGGCLVIWEGRTGNLQGTNWAFLNLGTAGAAKWTLTCGGRCRYYNEQDSSVPPTMGWIPRLDCASGDITLLYQTELPGGVHIGDEVETLGDTWIGSITSIPSGTRAKVLGHSQKTAGRVAVEFTDWKIRFELAPGYFYKVEAKRGETGAAIPADLLDESIPDEYPSQQGNAVTWEEWHALDIREGDDMAEKFDKVPLETIERLCKGIEGGRPHCVHPFQVALIALNCIARARQYRAQAEAYSKCIEVFAIDAAEAGFYVEDQFTGLRKIDLAFIQKMKKTKPVKAIP